MRVRLFDVMKTMDSRVHMDKETIDKYLKEYADISTNSTSEQPEKKS